GAEQLAQVVIWFWHGSPPGGKSGCFAGGQADGGGDAVQVLVGEAVAVVAELAGQGSLAQAFAVGGRDLADPRGVAEQAVAGSGAWDWPVRRFGAGIGRRLI